MNNAKRAFFILLTIILLLVSISVYSLGYTVSNYNVNGDTDRFGKAVVDIRDYMAAKTLCVQGSQFHSKDFLKSLRSILLGFEKLPAQNNYGGGIYLPEVP